jgi:hypothetical protein
LAKCWSKFLRKHVEDVKRNMGYIFENGWRKFGERLKTGWRKVGGRLKKGWKNV